MIEIMKASCDTTKLTAWLETTVRKHLKPDVSNYAKGRLRAWLRIEPSLSDPTKTYKGVPVSEKEWTRLQEIARFPFDFCLATYSGDETATGISPHRDAGYADFEAWGLNVSGECLFNYWMGRESFGRSTNKRELDPTKDDPTHSMILSPGDLVRFNCKNLHSASPGIKRWNLNFWRSKQK